MNHGVFTCVCCAFGLFRGGFTSLVETEPNVSAAVGGETQLSCRLRQHKDVQQVTWQKMSAKGNVNIATYNKYFGPTVNNKNKVELKGDGRQNCSIVIRGLTEEDQGVYRCMFNTISDGALIGTTSLQVYELHHPVLHVQESNSTEECIVSCSATGRPAPTLTLNVTQPDLHFLYHDTLRINKGNGTVTVTTTAVLTGFRVGGTQVGCVSHVLVGQSEVFVTIPGVKHTESADGSDEGSGYASICFIVIVAVACVCSAAIILVFKVHKSRGPERSEKPQIMVHDTDKSPAVSSPQEDNQLRKRTPGKMEKKGGRKPSTAAKKLLFGKIPEDCPC